MDAIELIIIFIKYCAIFAVIIAAILIMLFPLRFNSSLTKRTGTGCINYLLTVLETICMIAALNTDSPRFEGNLGLFVIVAVVAGVFARKKAKKRNLNEKDTVGAVAAQVLSPLSILLIIFVVSGIMNDIVEKKKKKK